MQPITIGAYVFYSNCMQPLLTPWVLADKLSYKIILLGFSLFAIVYGGFCIQSFCPGYFWPVLCIWYLCSPTEGVIKAWISNLAQKRTATAIGFYTSCESICTLLASIIAGALWATAGSTSTFLITSCNISIIVCIFFTENQGIRIMTGPNGSFWHSNGELAPELIHSTKSNYEKGYCLRIVIVSSYSYSCSKKQKHQQFFYRTALGVKVWDGGGYLVQTFLTG